MGCPDMLSSEGTRVKGVGCPDMLSWEWPRVNGMGVLTC